MREKIIDVLNNLLAQDLPRGEVADAILAAIGEGHAVYQVAGAYGVWREVSKEDFPDTVKHCSEYGIDTRILYTTPQPAPVAPVQQEPIGEVVPNGTWGDAVPSFRWKRGYRPAIGDKLYAAPQPSPDVAAMLEQLGKERRRALDAESRIAELSEMLDHKREESTAPAKSEHTHIKNRLSVQEIREQIASHEYGAEFLLQHAMLNIAELERVQGVLVESLGSIVSSAERNEAAINTFLLIDARAALAAVKPAQSRRMCCVDGDHSAVANCVFDSGDVENCAIAVKLAFHGRGRDACEHWRVPAKPAQQPEGGDRG